MNATSTGDDPTTTTTGDASTGTPIECGEPAAECVAIHREWCIPII